MINLRKDSLHELLDLIAAGALRSTLSKPQKKARVVDCTTTPCRYTRGQGGLVGSFSDCGRRLALVMFGLVVASTSVAPAGAAEGYAVSLTRKSSNFYKVDGQKIWVQTRYCFTYGYGEQASLSAYDVVFLDSDDKRDVRRVLQQADVTPGTYKVQATREADDLYATLEGTFLETNMCLSLSIGDEAIVRIGPGGYGSIRFIDNGDDCSVEAVLTELRL